MSSYVLCIYIYNTNGKKNNERETERDIIARKKNCEDYLGMKG